MRPMAGIALIIGSLMLPGCLAATSSFDAQARHVQQQVDSLTQRVARLEGERAGGASRGTSAATTTEASSSSSMEAAEAEAPDASERTAQHPTWFAANGRASFNKLSRGIANVITGWVEIPKRVDETTRRSGAGVGFTWGLLRGLGYGFVRTLAGAYEVVTFPFPAPPEYRPVMHPTFVFSEA